MQVLLFIGVLIVVYPLAPTLLAVAVIRAALGWSRSRRLILLSGLMAAPQAWMAVFVGHQLAAETTMPAKVLAGGLATLTLGALVPWWRAVIGAGKERLWLEPLVFATVTALLLASVDNWIVG